MKIFICSSLKINTLLYRILYNKFIFKSNFFLSYFQYHTLWLNFFKNDVSNNIRFAASNIEQVMESAPHKAASVRPPTTHHENYQS